MDDRRWDEAIALGEIRPGGRHVPLGALSGSPRPGSVTMVSRPRRPPITGLSWRLFREYNTVNTVQDLYDMIHEVTEQGPNNLRRYL